MTKRERRVNFKTFVAMIIVELVSAALFYFGHYLMYGNFPKWK